MYQSYWGLGQSPFRGNFDPRFFHQGPPQEEALARLHYLIEQQRPVGLLLGEAGSGKSLMLEMFARQLSIVGRQKALVNLVGLDARELVWLLCARLGVEVLPNASGTQMYRALADHLIANHFQKCATVLLLDNADEATAEVKDQITRLAEGAIARGVALSIVLTAQPSRLNRLGRRLIELSELRIDLDGWECEDTRAFIRATLAAAGRSTPLFTEPALERLHELSAGIPRRIKQLADLSLLVGAGQNLGQVEAEIIESAFRELGVVMPEPALVASAT